MKDFRYEQFPKTRIFTNDVCAVGLLKHHIPALIEVDVSESRRKVRQHKRGGKRISFTAWLIKVISVTVKEHEQAAAYVKGKRGLVIFNHVHVSMAVEKVVHGARVPIPLVIEKADDRSIESITQQIEAAQGQVITEKDIVLQSRANPLERVYYVLPGFLRRLFWKYLISSPHSAFSKMGNVSFTSVGMMGRATGWFIPISVHPVCFGIGRIAKKPAVVGNSIEIREMLYLTILMDHDVIDGALMARFTSALSENIEKGREL